MSKLLAIVPAYNEVDAIATTIADIQQNAPAFDVVVVDDGSTDATAQRARECGAEVVELPFNLGIGGAVQAGYLYAQDHGYDVAVQVDGDGQHMAAEIDTLLQHLRSTPGLNMVTGSRFLTPDRDGFRSSLTRRIGIRFFALLLSLITRQKVTDPTSGFRMCDRKAIELFARDYPHDYPEVEAVLMLHAHRLSRQEVPVRMRARTTGASSIRPLHSGLYMVKVLLAILIGLLRARPVVEPGDPAAVTAEPGI
ncbi:glycosyltransferase family 2 protein [Patulibacter sp. SYSU D01012]|uniref:glycosyltransferase family 2 protein n=1 Tax=Patulibacter sp. SYSU D01012 TaxID=2817381 RepID=UPI001B313C46|nr:glycosyltransferase family 2 protein [Patulibacter sp. SYSU D01012]